MQNLAKTAASGMMWLFGSTLIQYALQLISLIILARLLMPYDFGVVSASLVIVIFVKIFSYLGVGPAVIQKNDLTRIDIYTANSLSILLSFILFFLIIFFRNHIALLFRIEELSNILLLIAWIIPISGLSVVPLSLIRSEEHTSELQS